MSLMAGRWAHMMNDACGIQSLRVLANSVRGSFLEKTRKNLLWSSITLHRTRLKSHTGKCRVLLLVGWTNHSSEHSVSIARDWQRPMKWPASLSYCFWMMTLHPNSTLKALSNTYGQTVCGPEDIWHVHSCRSWYKPTRLFLSDSKINPYWNLRENAFEKRLRV
jgi:hypothetical protein